MKLRINEKETPNIEVKHEGILEVPEGKNVDDLPLSHFVNLANKKGLSKITKALNNLQVWNKNDDPKLSKWAGNMIDKLNKKLKKDESLTIKEDNVSHWDIWTETDYSLFIDGNRVKYPKYTTDRYGNYPMMVLPRYNDKTNTLCWCLYVDDGDGEMRSIEDQFINSYEAMDAGEDYYSRYLKKDESLNKSLVKESSKESYWKYYLNDKAIERMENSDRYFDEHSIKQVKLYPCETEDECYEGDFWPVRKSDYPYTAIFGTKDEAYKELMYSLNNSMYERENDL